MNINITRKYGNRKDKEGKQNIRVSDGKRAEQRVRDTGRVRKEIPHDLHLDKSVYQYIRLHFKPDTSVGEWVDICLLQMLQSLHRSKTCTSIKPVYPN